VLLYLSTDTRATKLALERHESTREDFAPNHQNDGLSIILNIDRSGGDESSVIHWPSRPAIDSTCAQITSGEERKRPEVPPDNRRGKF
jgi:hypothetical protein